ncbi:mCG145997, isoform CRA_a, partial [Mus musculus]
LDSPSPKQTALAEGCQAVGRNCSLQAAGCGAHKRDFFRQAGHWKKAARRELNMRNTLVGVDSYRNTPVTVASAWLHL